MVEDDEARRLRIGPARSEVQGAEVGRGTGRRRDTGR